MITLLIADSDEKIKQIISKMLNETGNANIDIIKKEDLVKIVKKDNLKELVSLEEKIIELEDLLLREQRGNLYKSLLERIEKPIIEHILERSEGNQLKAARILGMNRNTIRSKIKRLGIDASRWKIIK
jgi:two-component system nitrogen regulation response regulator GlnG